MLDPVLLVGKTDIERPDLRLLLTREESEKIMPILEKTFLTFQDDADVMLPWKVFCNLHQSFESRAIASLFGKTD